ncbi:MAG TPA: 4'-phosphopantetheinyl transferase [Cyanobacteria bacterium UBA11162]|nr:4'-phosphopantetheinyl transferase [Cyanobacteria bacterium UBA11162]
MTTLNTQWCPPPTDLSLSAGDVHVWCTELDLPIEQIENLAQILSPDEQQRADRFYFERDKKHFIAGRGILRTILGRYLDLAPTKIEFSYSLRGKPALANTDINKAFNFNLSHSKGLALYAVSKSYSLGIDLEYSRTMPDAEQLAKRFFSTNEYKVIRTLPNDQKQEAFFNAWTRKEAYLKATGEGLMGLSQVEVSLIPGEPPRLLSIAGDQQAASHWSLYHLIPAPDYIAALAVEGQGGNLSYFGF